MEKNKERKNLVQSVERALNILEAVRDNGGPIRAVDIANKVGLSVTAANNLVRTLYIRGYLDQNDQSRYILGGQSFLLGNAADAWSNLRSAAREPMEELSRIGETQCFLGVVYNQQIIGVNIAESQGPITVPQRQNWTDQFHSTAVGKVLLAEMPQEDYDNLKESYSLNNFTKQTITSWNTLEKELNVIRQQKYSVAHDESVFGVTSIGVPVVDNENNIIASLAVTFSSYFHDDEHTVKMLKLLNNASKKITRGLD